MASDISNPFKQKFFAIFKEELYQRNPVKAVGLTVDESNIGEVLDEFEYAEQDKHDIVELVEEGCYEDLYYTTLQGLSVDEET